MKGRRWLGLSHSRYSLYCLCSLHIASWAKTVQQLTTSNCVCSSERFELAWGLCW